MIQRAIYCCLGMVGMSLSGVAQPAFSEEESLAIRETPTVRVLREVQPAVAAVYVFSENRRGSGSGAIIDPRGYVLTAKHVVGDDHVVLLDGRPPMRARLIGTMPEYDLAILKLGRPAFNRPASPTYPRAGTPFTHIPLGVADEVLLGESVLNVGAPGGRGIVVTRGIVSAINITGGNALSAATQSTNGFNQLLQFDAASNPGNSGGPLVNSIGQQIGVVTGSVRGEEGIHFAVPLATIRRSLSQMLYPELRYRYQSGIQIDPQRKTVVVTEVESGSPAEQAGMQVGDEIISIGGRPLRDPVDWEFTRFDWREGQEQVLGIRRGSKEMALTIRLVPREPTPGLDDANMKPGVLVRAAPYDARVPDPLDDAIQPAGPATVASDIVVKPDGFAADEHYELVIDGFLKIDETDLYRLALDSDDGSKLFLHDRLVVDNGGNHASQIRTGWAYLAAGFHPFRIEFYEDEGNESLQFLIARGDAEPAKVAADKLFHRAQEE